MVHGRARADAEVQECQASSSRDIAFEVVGGCEYPPDRAQQGFEPPDGVEVRAPSQGLRVVVVVAREP